MDDPHLAKIGHQLIKLRDCCCCPNKLTAGAAGAAMDVIYREAKQLTEENAELKKHLSEVQATQLPLTET